MALSQNALEIGIAVRSQVGSESVGVGPDIETLVGFESLSGMTGPEMLQALMELERKGMFRVERRLGTPRAGIPNELRSIAGVTILEPMQALLDEMGL